MKFALSFAILLLSAAPVSADTFQVRAGDSLQYALTAAQPGDVIVLEAGARFVGNFSLPPKPFGAVITIRGAATLPERRLTAADSVLLPKMASPTVEPALVGFSTANWRIDGVQFESTKDGQYNIVYLQDATNITLDRIVIIGGPSGQRRAIMGNGRAITLTRSHIANIWRTGEESQAFAAWDGGGPYTITDNYLEAASEGILFGGANSKSAANIPSDILVEGNHVTKRLEWKGQGKVVKNSFELKSAKRAVIRNNLFERNWSDGQNGYAILFTVRNDEGQSPWSVVEDVLFEKNVVRDTENGINILGYDGYQASGRAQRITIRNNLIQTSGTFLQIGTEAADITVDCNTVVNGGTFLQMYYGDAWVAGTSARRPAKFAVQGLTLTNTTGNHSEYGVHGEGAGVGMPAFALAPGYTWDRNVLAGTLGTSYPGTLRPTLEAHRAQFVEFTAYRLTATSSYRKAGLLGVDLGRQESDLEAEPVPVPVTDLLPPPPPPPAPVDCVVSAWSGWSAWVLVDPRVEQRERRRTIVTAPAHGGATCPALVEYETRLVPEPTPTPTPEPIPQPVPVPADTVAPAVSISAVIRRGNSHNYDIYIDARDANGVMRVEVLVNGEQRALLSAPPYTAVITIRSAGSSLVEVRAVDAAGNIGTASRTVVR